MDREDYTDPICPFCTDMFKKNIKRIPTDRVISKLDEYFGRNDYSGAEKHLLYWLSEAENEGDLNGEFTVRNELMGLYRKIGKMDKALEHTHAVLELVEKMGNKDSISAATAYLNAGTAYKAADNPEKSIEFFKSAQAIYEKHLDKDDSRLAGLYNNMALTLTALKNFADARNYYEKAIAIMQNKENGLLDCAISYLNMADTEEAEFGLENAEEKINLLLKKATDALESKENEHNGYYAFVCEKCASAFGYYGYFAYENELKERAKRIYERA
ncbi:MAG: tetratricopeptide repeat protein [Clostridia bacterium]|nr:tetratricopeptide repeat protein [Clostridia bacterium]